MAYRQTDMQTKIVEEAELREVIDKIPHGISRGILFSGDRYSCVDQGVAILEGEILVALSTIAPDGEMLSGKPTIVGFWINPLYRQQGYGQQLMEETVRQCISRGFKSVQLDALVFPIKRIYEKLPEGLKQYIDFRDLIIPLITSLPD